MIPSNVRNGFSLIEVTMALAIIGILLTSTYSLQQASIKASTESDQSFSRILLLKNTLYDPAIVRENHDQEIKKSQTSAHPPTNITIDQQPAAQEALKKYPLEQIQVHAKWEGLFDKEDESLLFLRVIPLKPKDIR